MRVSFPAKAVLSDETLKQEGKSDGAARGEHRQHPDHDGGISAGQDFANVDVRGERPRKMDARRVAHGHEESVLSSIQSLSRAADGLLEHEQSGPRLPRVQ